MNKKIREEISQILDLHKGLILTFENDFYVISGIDEFELKYENKLIHNKFNLVFKIPINFPNSVLPSLKLDEYPNGFSHIFKDNIACMATISEQIIFISNNESIFDFWEKFVLSFLFTTAYYNNHGIYPFGERQHGSSGIISYYRETYGFSKNQIIKMINYISNQNYRGHDKCFCGSGKKIRNCHKDLVQQIMKNPNLVKLMKNEMKILERSG